MPTIELYTVPWWLFGVVLLLWPGHVLRFYERFLGADRMRAKQFQIRHVRNSGVVWLVVMAVFAYVDWRWPD
jgi:hypothetical protein